MHREVTVGAHEPLAGCRKHQGIEKNRTYKLQRCVSLRIFNIDVDFCLPILS